MVHSSVGVVYVPSATYLLSHRDLEQAVIEEDVDLLLPDRTEVIELVYHEIWSDGTRQLP